jgi:predicted acyl esterase
LEIWQGCADMTQISHDLTSEGLVPRESSYPSSWQVVFAPAATVPVDYVFGPQNKFLKKGSVFPPTSRPLVCDIAWDRDVPVTLRDGVTIYTDILRPVGGGQVPAIVAWSPYGKTIPQTDVQAGVDPSKLRPS